LVAPVIAPSAFAPRLWNRGRLTNHPPALTLPPSPAKSAKTAKNRVDEAADRLRGDILRGMFAAGSDLPGERELSTRIGVSRLTLRSAIERLSSEGLVRSVHGSGNRVLDFRDTGGVELLGHLVTVALEGGEFPIALLKNLLELRRVVAIDAVALAAARCAQHEVDELRASLDEQEAAIGDTRAYMSRDLQFAKLLARATHNLALVLLTNTIVRVIEQQPGVELTFILDPRGAIASYRRMLALIEERDPDSARERCRKILERYDRALLSKVVALTEADAAKSPRRANGTPASRRPRPRVKRGARP
jgi:GntR family transcriptional repressor for pyruvate dehydrogenase complex